EQNAGVHQRACCCLTGSDEVEEVGALLGGQDDAISFCTHATSMHTAYHNGQVSRDGTLVDIGAACYAYQDATLRNLPCKRLQCDEIWAFCHSKQKNVAPEHEGIFGYGDVWTWTAIDADTK